MSDDTDRLILIKEHTRLNGECARCSDVQLKAEITMDIALLKEAIALLLLDSNAT